MKIGKITGVDTTAETDSPLEEAGFEPSIHLVNEVPGDFSATTLWNSGFLARRGCPADYARLDLWALAARRFRLHLAG